jgi:hypothetical protein
MRRRIRRVAQTGAIDAGIKRGYRRARKAMAWFGDDHNLVVLRATILEAPARFGDERMTAGVLGCMAKYQTTLRRRALKCEDQLFASTPTAFSAQIDR